MAFPLHRLKELALASGLHLVGVTSLAPLEEHRARLRKWQEAGYAGDMQYMLRDSDLFTSPERLIPGAGTLIMVAVAYERGPLGERPPGHGRVARYAWGRDYHKVLPRRLRRLVALLEEEMGGSLQSRIFSDAISLLERALAARAHLGFIGKNTLLIRPREGSYVLLGGVVVDTVFTDGATDGVPRESELVTIAASKGGSTSVVSQSHGSCGSCSRCLERCPTGALVEEYTLDARLCISYLTIEKRGSLSWEDRLRLNEWVFGCDVCQDVCPFNHQPRVRESPPHGAEFSSHAGAGPFLELSGLLRLRSEADFLRRFAGTPLMRAKRSGLLRNACCVAANLGDAMVLDALREAAREDPSAIVRAHALWSLARFAGHWGAVQGRELDTLLCRAEGDPDPQVVAEARMIRDSG